MTYSAVADLIFDLLLATPDGLTSVEIRHALNVDRQVTHRALGLLKQTGRAFDRQYHGRSIKWRLCQPMQQAAE